MFVMMLLSLGALTYSSSPPSYRHLTLNRAVSGVTDRLQAHQSVINLNSSASAMLSCSAWNEYTLQIRGEQKIYFLRHYQ